MAHLAIKRMLDATWVCEPDEYPAMMDDVKWRLDA
jgi:hypothetical protein